MSLLLDTHTFLWWLGGDPMAEDVTAEIADPATLVAVSSASVWEISVKAALGKLRFSGSIADQVSASGFEPLPISLAHAERAGALPGRHRDPFDRMLVAQAQLERLTIVTRDSGFASYDVRVRAC
ncbi:MAG TPA: type II toxin-antitoxin system VapC family toxin [Acidimicrobiales bacterium]|nr:type II toxin-antitoxin system VapC family toxin [Acidimicrobiales bacterium]